MPSRHSPITGARGQIPACGHELVARDPATVIHRLSGAFDEIGNDLTPDHVPIAFDDDMRAAEIPGFIGIEGGVDAAVHDAGAALPGRAAHLHAPKGVAGMDAYADNIAGMNGIEVHSLQRLVRDDGVAAIGGVAATSTYSQRGVITPMPNEVSLGLIR